MVTKPCAGCDGCALAGGDGHSPPTVVPYADVVVVGEAPGRQEIGREPFVGSSGARLRKVLQSAGYDLSNVTFVNVVNCRPPSNRLPSVDEAWRCRPLLSRVIEASKASVVLAVGRFAIDNMVGMELTKELVASRSTWDGYVFTEEDVPTTVFLGIRNVDKGNVYKSGKNKGKPKIEKERMYAQRIPVKYVMGCLHPAGVQRSGFKNMEQMVAAIKLSHAVSKGAKPFGDVLHMQDVQFIEHPGQWHPEVPAYTGAWGLAFDIENPNGVMDRIGLAEINFTDEGRQITRIASWTWNPAVKEALQQIFHARYNFLFAHNLVYDVQNLIEEGVGFPRDAPFFDTMMAAQIDQPDLPKALGAMWRYMPPMRPWKHLAREDQWTYNMIDAVTCAHIGVTLVRKLEKRGSYSLAVRQTRGTLVLGRMTTWGIRVDREWLDAWEDKLEDAVQRKEEEWQALVGDVPYSGGKRLQEFLYEKLGLPVLEQTETGQAGTSEAILSRLLKASITAEQEQVIATLLELRGLRKLISTYARGYRDHIGPDGKVHPYFLPSTKDAGDLGAASGRLSCTPNLQNAPEEARGMFVPSFPGWKLGYTDMRAVEGRVQAAISGDTELLEMYDRPDFDMHTYNLGVSKEALLELWNSDPGKWKERLAQIEAGMWPIDRPKQKGILYAYNYGAGVNTISKQTALTPTEVKAVIAAYEKQRPLTAKWRQDIVARAKSKRFLQNPFGRVRWFRGAVGDPHVQNAAINFLPQSIVADMFWFIYPDAELLLEKAGGRLLMQVHDAFLWEAPAGKQFRQAAQGLEWVMGQEWPSIAKGFRVPVTHEIGDRWSEMEEYKP